MSQNDMNEEIVAALRVLAADDAGREAPLRVEDRVRKVFRRKYGWRKWRAAGAWSFAVAAGLALFFAVGSRERPSPVIPAPVALKKAVPAPAPPVEIMAAPDRKPAPRVRPSARQPREIVTEFFPLLDAAPPFERGELLRVTVPASTMRRVGLPVNEDHLTDRVYADVLVGQEGLARAIRFVSYEQ